MSFALISVRRFAAVFAVLVPLLASPAFAQHGIQTSRDGGRILVSKDVGAERWAITRNLDDLSVTGNVYFTDGRDPQFISCDLVASPSSYACYGADSCETSCPGYTFIANVDLPESFFRLPTGPGPATPTPERTPTDGGKSVFRWTLHDGCSDGRGLIARFFDKTDGGLWPDPSHVYVTESGGTIDRNLSCDTGHKICFGAAPDGDASYHWGVGIEGDQGCDDCCSTCGDFQRSLNLICR